MSMVADVVASIAAVAPVRSNRQRRGRPCQAESRADRMRNIQCAYLHKVNGLALDGLARYYGVSLSTVHRWIERVRDYDDPEAVDLRRIVR